jgi:hypothetical protein
MDEAPAGRRPTRLVLGAAALFAVAVFLARLILAGGAGWVAFALVVPVLLVALTAAVSFRFAAVAVALFAALVVALRWFLERSQSQGWIALLLLPVLAFTGVLVGRVLATMRRDRRARREAAADGGEAPPQP